MHTFKWNSLVTLLSSLLLCNTLNYQVHAEGNENLKILSINTNKAKQTNIATVKVFNTNSNVVLDFSKEHANKKDVSIRDDNTIEIPASFSFLLEDSDDAETAGIITNKNQENEVALLLNLDNDNNSSEEIILKPKINIDNTTDNSNDIGLAIKSADENSVKKYNVIVESTEINMPGGGTAISVESKINSLLINESTIDTTGIGVHLKIDSSKDDKTTFIQNKEIIGNPSILIDGANYNIHTEANSITVAADKDSPAITINNNNTYLANKLSASIAGKKTGILITEQSANNNIYNYGKITGFNPIVVKGENNNIDCIKDIKANIQDIIAICYDEDTMQAKEDTNEDKGILIYGSLTFKNDSSKIISDINTYDNGKLTLINNAGIIDSDEINIQDNSTFILENNGTFYFNSLKSSAGSTINIFNNKIKESQIQTKESQKPVIVTFAGDAVIRNQGNIIANVSSDKSIVINNEAKATIDLTNKANENNDNEKYTGLISKGNFYLENYGSILGYMENYDSMQGSIENYDSILGYMEITTVEPVTKEIQIINHGEISNNFDFAFKKTPIGHKNIVANFKNESSVDLAIIQGNINNTDNSPISIMNNGGLFIANNIGTKETEKNISIFNHEHGYWGVIYAKNIFANDIYNESAGYIITDNIHVNMLINEDNSILQTNYITANETIKNNSFLLADEIIGTTELSKLELSKEHNKLESTELTKLEQATKTIKLEKPIQLSKIENNGVIITSALSNIILDNSAITIVANDLNLSSDYQASKFNVQLAENKNIGKILCEGITLNNETKIINNGEIIADTIQTTADINNKAIIRLLNNNKITCRNIKNTHIVNNRNLEITDLRDSKIPYSQDIGKQPKIDTYLNKNKLVDDFLKSNNVEIISDKTGQLATDDKSLETSLDVINLKKNHVESKLFVPVIKNLEAINTIKNFFNHLKKPTFEGEVYIELADSADKNNVKLILDKNGVINNAKLHLSYKDKQNSAIAIPENVITGKLINQHRLYLTAGSYLDTYTDIAGSTLIINVHEDLDNFMVGKPNSKALLYINDASFHINDKIIVITDNPKTLTANQKIKTIRSRNPVKHITEDSTETTANMQKNIQVVSAVNEYEEDEGYKLDDSSLIQPEDDMPEESDEITINLLTDAQLAKSSRRTSNKQEALNEDQAITTVSILKDQYDLEPEEQAEGVIILVANAGTTTEEAFSAKETIKIAPISSDEYIAEEPIIYAEEGYGNNEEDSSNSDEHSFGLDSGTSETDDNQEGKTEDCETQDNNDKTTKSKVKDCDNQNNKLDESSISAINSHKHLQRVISYYLYNNCMKFCSLDNNNDDCADSSVWVKSFLSRFKQSAVNNNHESTNDFRALLLGVDHQLEKNIIGIAAGLIAGDSTSEQQKYSSNINTFSLYTSYINQEYVLNTEYSYEVGKHKLDDHQNTYKTFAHSLHLTANSCFYKYDMQIIPNINVKIGNIFVESHQITINDTIKQISEIKCNYIEAGLGVDVQKLLVHGLSNYMLSGHFGIWRDLYNNSYYDSTSGEHYVWSEPTANYNYEFNLAIDFSRKNLAINLEFLHQVGYYFTINSITCMIKYSF